MIAIIFLFVCVGLMVGGVWYYCFYFLRISSENARKIEIFGYFTLLVYTLWQFIIKDILMREFYYDNTAIVNKIDWMFIYFSNLARGIDTDLNVSDFLSIGKDKYVQLQILCCDIITAALQIVSCLCIGIGRIDDIAFKKKNMNNDYTGKKEKTIIFYKPNIKLYIILIIVALSLTLISYFMLTENKIFTIFAGIGSGAIASVIIAWLIDYFGTRQKNILNEQIINHLFSQFDLSIEYELGLIIVECAKEDNNIDLKYNYSIAEVIEIIKNADGMLPIWDCHYHNLGVYFNFMDPAAFLVADLTSQHLEIYQILKRCINTHAIYSFMS